MTTNTPDSGRKIACKSCPFRENSTVNWRSFASIGAHLVASVRRNKGRFPCHTDHTPGNGESVGRCGPTGANDCVGFQHMLRGKKGYLTFAQLNYKAPAKGE
jgi:hypothetical protein